MSEEITKERERIKEIIEVRADRVIELRAELKNYRAKRTISISGFKKFVENVLFRIDNPDYVRVKDRIPESPQTQD